MVNSSAIILRLFLLMIKVTSLLPQTMHEAIDLRCINKLCLAVLKSIKNLSQLIVIFLKDRTALELRLLYLNDAVETLFMNQ